MESLCGGQTKMKNRIDSAALLWLGVVMLITLSIAFLLPVTPQDYWWYLRIGKDTLASGAVPRIDTLSFSQAGTPVDYQSWGAALIFWLTYQLGGLSLTFLLRGFLIGITYSIIWITSRRAGVGRLVASLVLLAAVLTSSNNWSIRPQLFAYPLFALCLFILYEWQNGKKNIVWWLPLISLVWVNLHGSFVMLILLAGAALVLGHGDKRRMAGAFAGIMLATLFNPRGWGTWFYVYRSLTIPSSQLFSAEWLPPVNSGWQMNIFFLWLLTFPLLTAISPNKPDRLEWTWFLGFGILGLWGERYVIWFVLILAVLTARIVSKWEKKSVREGRQNLFGINLALFVVFLLMPLTLLPGVREAWWKQSPPATDNTPVNATNWLQAHPEIPGPLWSEIGFSSYLEFSLPERPTWIDTRFEVFPVKQWQTYKNISNARFDWQSSLEQTGVNLLMISRNNQPALISALEGSVEWCESYQDQIAIIYQRVPCGGE
jgi:hypothetical protein